MTILVTGAAGFLGFHLSQKLLSGNTDQIVIGIDSILPYYDISLKRARLKILKNYPNFIFYENTICDKAFISNIFQSHTIEYIIHFAAQAGVRHSIQYPLDGIETNLTGFTLLLEAARIYHVKHFLYASSSTVYGSSLESIFSETDNIDSPLCLYAASKRYNELAAHAYASAYQLPTTGLRFFSVYGPWGRPDMAFFTFTKAILEDRPIDLYNYGNTLRDFTYIDDVIEAIALCFRQPPQSDKPCRLYNVGNGQSVKLLDYIHALEDALGKNAILNPLPIMSGEMQATQANMNRFIEDFGYKPTTPYKVGIKYFVKWYKETYLELPISTAVAE